MLQPRHWMDEALHQFFDTEIRAWNGREPLRIVFWLYGVLANVIVGTLYVMAMMENRAALQQALIAFYVGYSVWVLVSVWRCAQSSDPVWTLLARSLSVAWAANAALLVLFLEIDLLTQMLRQ